MKKNERGTAESVAHKAGVSIYTVSRVFAGTGKVSEATRARVLAIARELNYAPNPASRALRSGRLNTMAFVMTGQESLLGEFYTTMLAGLQTVMAGRNMDVLLSILPKDRLEEWLHDHTATRRCGALAILDERPETRVLDLLRTIKQPVVILNTIPEKGLSLHQLDSVGFDNAAGIEQAVRHVYSLGHRDITYFGGPPGWQDSIQRERGFRRAMAQCALKVNEDRVIACDFAKAFTTGSAAMDLILGRSVHRPTAVICASDEIAMGAISSARRWGIEVPRDISITGFDNLEWCGFHHPPLTSILHSGWSVGFRSANLLLSRYEEPDRPYENIVLPTQLVVRQSTAPPPVEGRRKK